MKEKQIRSGWNRGTIFRYCSWIPAVIIMITIFKFSAANGVESSGTSSGLLECVFTKAENILPIEIQMQKKEWLIEVLETPLRKCAHMTEYMCLAISVMFPFYLFGKRGKYLIYKSAIVSILYACTDELHQYFVPGRAGRIMDICIDGMGVWIGIGIGISTIKLISKLKKMNTKKIE